MRLFVAVVPPADAVAALGRLQHPEHPAIRWSPPSQWHVTLRFLGEVYDVGGVSAALGLVAGWRRELGEVPPEAAVGPSTAPFSGGRVLQVPVGGLDRLAAVVAHAVAPWAPPDERAFAGHLTVARARGAARWPALPGAGQRVAVTFPVGGVALVASTLGQMGARHRVVRRVQWR